MESTPSIIITIAINSAHAETHIHHPSPDIQLLLELLAAKDREIELLRKKGAVRRE